MDEEFPVPWVSVEATGVKYSCNPDWQVQDAFDDMVEVCPRAAKRFGSVKSELLIHEEHSAYSTPNLYQLQWRLPSSGSRAKYAREWVIKSRVFRFPFRILPLGAYLVRSIETIRTMHWFAQALTGLLTRWHAAKGSPINDTDLPWIEQELDATPESKHKTALHSDEQGTNSPVRAPGHPAEEQS